MKKTFSLLAFAMYCACSFAQEPVLTFNGNLYFIPASMTKNGEAFLVSASSGDDSFTIYDGDFNVVKTFTDLAAGQPYQERVVTMTRIYDPSEEGWGSGGIITRAAASDEWTVVDDQISDHTTSSTISGFEVYSDNNNYHSRYLYVSQTLFDDDEEFEFVRRKQTIIPITTKRQEDSNDNVVIIFNPYGGDNEKMDSLKNATGADSYEWFWDEESGKQLIRLYKHERYGGLCDEGMEIVSLDGTVKANLPSIDYISSAYYFRGKCYVEGYGNNSRVLYLLGNGTSDIRELSRTKADLTIRRFGNSLVVESDTNEQQTIVMSTMDGKVVRSLSTTQNNNTLSLNGIPQGVYIVTLYRQSTPLKSSKIIIK